DEAPSSFLDHFNPGATGGPSFGGLGSAGMGNAQSKCNAADGARTDSESLLAPCAKEFREWTLRRPQGIT
ncbi:MAG: hypothetical protein QXQ50_09270, partial [Candidatus Bathyarchaeia archaeon]